jgi:hypothetical protein
MKKILLILIILSVLQTTATAQVDLSLFTKNQIWLFTKKAPAGIWNGIAFLNNGQTYMYSNGVLDKELCMSKNKSLRQPHFCHDIDNMWCTEYELIGNKIRNPRSAYDWIITKLTTETMILEREKTPRSEPSDFYQDNATKMVFKRQKATQKRYPKWTSGSSEDCRDMRRNHGNDSMIEEYIKFRK